MRHRVSFIFLLLSLVCFSFGFSSQAHTILEEGKTNIVVFISKNCPCSLSHEKELNSLAREFERLGLNFTGIFSNSDEAEAEIKNHLKENPLEFEVVFDQGQVLANQWAAFKTPHAFVFGSDGKILYQGAVSDSRHFPAAKRFFLRNALNEISKGKSVSIKKTKPLGCEIRR